MPRRKRDLELGPDELDLNRVVAANFRAAREFRGWTQQEAATRLSDAMGYDVPQASISIIERSVSGNRPRNITADELAGFAKAFDLPILWFLRPTEPGKTLVVGSNGEPMAALPTLVYGTESQMAEMRSAVDADWAPELAAATSRYSAEQINALVKARDQYFTAQLDSTRRQIQSQIDELAELLEPLTKILGTADDGLLQPRWEGRLSKALLGGHLANVIAEVGEPWDVLPGLFGPLATQFDEGIVDELLSRDDPEVRAATLSFLEALSEGGTKR